ncbi:MAG: sulfite exporter TauE/SafE family protein [Bacteroidetes bacterium]|nr:sulfite exporter TauE/SafE family protein [Bacteroidota bacterium]
MEILYIALLTILASGIGTITGFGTSTILIPILLLYLPLPETLLVVGVIHFSGDIWKMILFRKGFEWKLILTFGLTGIIASFLGARIVFSASPEILLRILGAFMLAYVIFLVFKPDFKVPKKNLTAITGGGLSGFFAGIFGVGGAIRTLFLSAFDLQKAVFVATTGAIAFLIDSTRIATYLINGVRLEDAYLWGFLAFIPASFAGTALAKKLVDKIPQRWFRMVVALFLFIMGIKFLIFP